MDEAKEKIRQWLRVKTRTEDELVEKIVETMETTWRMTTDHNQKVLFHLLFKDEPTFKGATDDLPF